MIFCQLSNSRGQVAVLFALIFPLFVLLLAFFVNMGLLINQKIRLQNAVDAGVYSATASLAADLNKMARINWEIKQAYNGDPSKIKYTSGWGGPSYSSLIEGKSFNSWIIGSHEMKHGQYQNYYYGALGKIKKINRCAVGGGPNCGDNPRGAIGRGIDAALLTFYNGDPALVASNPNKLNFKSLGKQAGQPMIDDNDVGSKFIQHAIEREIHYHKVRESDNNPFDPYEGHTTLKKRISLPISKSQLGSKVKFAAELEAEAGFKNIWPDRFQVRPRHYDSAARQIKLKAYAAGQPYNGSLKGLRDTYRATLIPLKKFDGSRKELH